MFETLAATPRWLSSVPLDGDTMRGTTRRSAGPSAHFAAIGMSTEGVCDTIGESMSNSYFQTQAD